MLVLFDIFTEMIQLTCGDISCKLPTMLGRTSSIWIHSLSFFLIGFVKPGIRLSLTAISSRPVFARLSVLK